MIGITNAGAPQPIAFVNVTYPSGSTCTMTNGTVTYTAPDTSGSYRFKLAKGGSWTISVTDGTQTVSKAVSVQPFTVTSTQIDYTAIPSDLRSTYYEVEYINFLSGSIDTFVDTGITATDNAYDIEVAFTPTEFPASNVFGAIAGNEYFDGSYYYYQGIMIKDGKFVLSYGCPYFTTPQYADGPAATVGMEYKLKAHLGAANTPWTLSVDDSVAITATSIYGILQSSTLVLGTRWYSSVYNSFCTVKGKYGKAKIWKDSAVVAELIPCVRRSDSVCGYLNLTDRTFHFNADNAGTNPGSATPGPSIGS